MDEEACNTAVLHVYAERGWFFGTFRSPHGNTYFTIGPDQNAIPTHHGSVTFSHFVVHPNRGAAIAARDKDVPTTLGELAGLE